MRSTESLKLALLVFAQHLYDGSTWACDPRNPEALKYAAAVMLAVENIPHRFLYIHALPSNSSSMRNDPYADATASYWVTQIASALRRADSEVFSQLFLPNGWLRDLLVFSGDTRALVGRDKIHSYLRDTLQGAQISNVGISDDPHLLPRMYLTTVMHTIHGDIVEFAFTFECLRGHGRGRTVLYLNQATRTYSIASMMMMLSDIKGYEELTLRHRLAGGYEGNMQGSSPAWIKEVEIRPHVLIGRLINVIIHGPWHPDASRT